MSEHRPMNRQPTMQKIVVVGAGAWGTALAIHLARKGLQVVLWTHQPDHAKHLAADRENTRYLKDIPFPEGLAISADLNQAMASASAVLVVVPSQAFRSVLMQVKAQFQSQRLPHLAWATKGFEPESSLMLHQIAQQVWGEAQPMAVLSGPTFAAEVAKGLPTAMVSASEDTDEANFWAETFRSDRFRMYTQSDMIGVEIGGAYKNIMAIATGLSDGLQLGANARAALIGRGMAEMMRLGAALGANPETLMGLSGLGDLVLTCTDNLSRNRRFGLALASDQKKPDAIMAEIGQVVEGVKAVKSVKKLAEEHQLELPIMEQVYRIVTGECSAKAAVKALMDREGRAEQE